MELVWLLLWLIGDLIYNSVIIKLFNVVYEVLLGFIFVRDGSWCRVYFLGLIFIMEVNMFF